MASLRWRKLAGDLRAMPGRVVAMVLALAISLIGFGAVLGARTVLRREISASYLASHPADATLELAGDVDAATVAAVRARPGIGIAEARGTIVVRATPGPGDGEPHAPHGADAGTMHGTGGFLGMHGIGGAATHGDGAASMHGGEVATVHGGEAATMHGGEAALHHPGDASGEPASQAGAAGGMHAAAAGPWQPLQLFVVDDFAALQLNVFRRESGAWPPPTGTMLLERSAVGMLGAGEDAPLLVKSAHGAPRPMAVSGVVHDTGLAPAWQERKGYGYITRDTLAALGEPPVLHELRVAFQPAPADRAEAEAAAASLASWLAASGRPVHEIRVPPLRQHPHQSQMTTAQMVLLVFGALLFVLSAILVATLLAAMLARQVREIGVMKALGACTGQLAGMYAGAVVAIGALAAAIALPLGALGAHAIVDAIAGMLNLAVADPAIPPWVFAVQAAAGIAVPLALAALPIRRACRLTVRDALSQHGARAEAFRPALRKLPMAARDALRRPARLALSLSLLTAGGVIATTAFNVKRAYEANLDRMPGMWHHDLDIRLADPAPVALAGELAAIPGVRVAEPWGYAAAAFARTGQVDVVRTYPDQGHGSFPLFGVPSRSALLDLPLVEGRWLAAGDRDAIVVSAGAGRHVGDTLALSLDGVPSTWTIVGVVDSLPAGGGYVTDAAFARAAHTEGTARTFRIATTAHAGAELRATQARIERELARRGVAVTGTLAFATLRDAMDAHVLVLARAAVLLSAIIALIGLVGLAATTGISVVARTREIGMMKAIGANDRRIFRLIVGEALLVGLASWLASVVLTLPLTAAIDRYLTSLGFLGARWVISPGALVAWLAAVSLGSIAAAAMPARRAARLTVREALAEP
jgi:putative ABC transport system permease protein